MKVGEYLADSSGELGIAVDGFCVAEASTGGGGELIEPAKQWKKCLDIFRQIIFTQLVGAVLWFTFPSLFASLVALWGGWLVNSSRSRFF
ncbi:unnamed protein product [Camellia sinensis]